jgi:single-strand DNA-binding protein
MTTITIVGNMTRDPEIRYTPSGAQSVRFGVAVNRRWRDQQTGEWKEAEPSFFDVVCWRDLADNVAESLSKGSRVIVTGRMEQRSWQDQDGNRRSAWEITADEVGPSLRFATASVNKVDRRGPDAGRQVPNQPSEVPSGGSGGGGGADYANDEEPF